MKITAKTNRAVLLGLALLGTGALAGLATPASAQPNRERAAEAPEPRLEEEEGRPAPDEMDGPGERQPGRRRGQGPRGEGRRGGPEGPRGEVGPGMRGGPEGPESEELDAPGRPRRQRGERGGFQNRPGMRGSQGQGEEFGFDGPPNPGEAGPQRGGPGRRGPGRGGPQDGGPGRGGPQGGGPERGGEFRDAPDDQNGPRQRPFGLRGQGQGRFGQRGQSRPDFSNRPDDQGPGRPRNGGFAGPQRGFPNLEAQNSGTLFRGTVVQVRSNQSFDVKVDGKTFNVYTLTSTPATLSTGDTVRINGVQKYNNDIRDATVSVIENR